jgi:dipeptidyl aminopeptidase/acylaminoacyl peptidase
MKLRTLLVLVCLLPAPLLAQSARRALTIEDYYRLKSIGIARISPDGAWLMYGVATRVEENNGSLAETWVVPIDGRAPARRIQHEGRAVTAVDWAEDGRLRYRIDNNTWLYDLKQSAPRGQQEKANEAQAERSPDGKWLAFTQRVAPAREPRVYGSDFEKRHEERFKGRQFDWLNYKRDGARAPVPDPRSPVENPPAEIFLTSTRDGATRQLTKLALQANALAWKPDGSALVFTADPDYRAELTYGGSELWLVTLDGSTKQITNDDYVYSSPAFSPDGKLLAYTRTFGTDMVIKQKLDHGGPRDLFVMPAAGGAPRNLTEAWDNEPGAPLWSPDGRYIYFTAVIGGESHLFRVPTAGGAVEQVTRGPRRLNSLSIDRAFRRIAYTVGTHEAPSEVYVANIDGTGERKLTDVHGDFLAQVQPSRTERVNYQSRDGTPIEGWVTFPYGYTPNGGPYPLIVSNHGGPHSAIGYGYDFKNQFFAANGYFVLEVNFRSSTGYGEKFKWATWGGWGNKDGEDVLAGVDYVLGKFPIDRARVGTTGHSYGGFMTNWLITQYPARFAAAVSGAGISNWISDYGLADIARTKETEFYGKPWEPEALAIMVKQSPLFYADRVKTPTLFVHGEVDYRVPYAEAEQFYFALKKNGVPAKIIQYEGQPHGIGGHWNNVHRMLNELRWWNTYLRKSTS